MERDEAPLGGLIVAGQARCREAVVEDALGALGLLVVGALLLAGQVMLEQLLAARPAVGGQRVQG